jgi:uncharacterized membrane protein YdjX (TVP38/TMEM64 family)
MEIFVLVFVSCIAGFISGFLLCRYIYANAEKVAEKIINDWGVD